MEVSSDEFDDVLLAERGKEKSFHSQCIIHHALYADSYVFVDSKDLNIPCRRSCILKLDAYCCSGQ